MSFLTIETEFNFVALFSNEIQFRLSFRETEFNFLAIFRNGIYSVSIFRNKILLFLETVFL